MQKLFVILFVLASLSAYVLYRKFPGNTKQGFLARLCWYILVMPFSFIFLSENPTHLQTTVLSAFAVAGLIYFFYKFRSFSREKGNHEKLDSRLRSSET